MKILDSRGRLFGKLSILDFGAALVILLVIIGIFFYPGTSGSVAQVGATTKPVEVDVLVRGLSARKPGELLKQGDKTFFVIRNQDFGEVDIKSVEMLPRTVLVPQPDGSVKELPDPRVQTNFSNDLLLTLGGRGTVTNQGLTLGNNQLKIGTPVSLRGRNYEFNVSVIDLRY